MLKQLKLKLSILKNHLNKIFNPQQIKSPHDMTAELRNIYFNF